MTQVFFSFFLFRLEKVLRNINTITTKKKVAQTKTFSTVLNNTVQQKSKITQWFFSFRADPAYGETVNRSAIWSEDADKQGEFQAGEQMSVWKQPLMQCLVQRCSAGDSGSYSGEPTVARKPRRRFRSTVMVSAQTTRWEQFGVQRLAQGHFDMVWGDRWGIKPAAFPTERWSRLWTAIRDFLGRFGVPEAGLVLAGLFWGKTTAAAFTDVV